MIFLSPRVHASSRCGGQGAATLGHRASGSIAPLTRPAADLSPEGRGEEEGMFLRSSLWLHPLPTSPVEGEVLLHSFGSIVPQALADTSPSTGEAKRGWGNQSAVLKSCEVQS